MEERLFLHGLHQRYLGLSSDLYTSDVNLFFRHRKHQLSVEGSSMHEGPYIAQSRLVAGYAYFLRLSEKQWLSGGIKGALFNLKYDGSQSGVSGSDTQSGLALDVAWQRRRWLVYAAFQQLLAGDLRPLAYPIALKPFQELRAQYRLPLRGGRELIMRAAYTHFTDRTDVGALGLLVSLSPRSQAGILAYTYPGIAAQFRSELPLGDAWNLNLMGSYRIPANNRIGSLFAHFLEVGIAISKNIDSSVYLE
jgi:hypothetical protein